MLPKREVPSNHQQHPEHTNLGQNQPQGPREATNDQKGDSERRVDILR